MAAGTPNKGNGKGPILGPGNKPISESDRVKYNAVDKAQTESLKASNSLAAKKQKAVKAAVAGNGAKKVAAKPAPKKASANTAVVAKAIAKKAASKKGK